MDDVARLIGLRDLTIYSLEKRVEALEAENAELRAQIPEPNVPCVDERPIRLDRRRSERAQIDDEEPPGA